MLIMDLTLPLRVRGLITKHMGKTHKHKTHKPHGQNSHKAENEENQYFVTCRSNYSSQILNSQIF